uniref:hypothetical protein n=1 Tax=Enterobacter sp. TaxID=42895 RepID=UPI00296EA43F|nr:hypothetical protein [Enterobacter sp.]
MSVTADTRLQRQSRSWQDGPDATVDLRREQTWPDDSGEDDFRMHRLELIRDIAGRLQSRVRMK